MEGTDALEGHRLTTNKQQLFGSLFFFAVFKPKFPLGQSQDLKNAGVYHQSIVFNDMSCTLASYLPVGRPVCCRCAEARQLPHPQSSSLIFFGSVFFLMRQDGPLT